MKKILLIAFLGMGISGYSQGHEGHNHGPEVQHDAPAAAANPTAAHIQFKETSFDFGNLKEGPEAKHEFVFTNTGKEPLVLQACQPSCGCTAPQCPKEPVLPGQSNKITVVYSTAGRVGPFNKSITITSNAAESPMIIYIKGHVKETPPEKTLPINEDGGMMFGQ